MAEDDLAGRIQKLIPKEMQLIHEDVQEEYIRFKIGCSEGRDIAYLLGNFVTRLPYTGLIGSPRCYFDNFYPKFLDEKPEFDPAHGYANYSDIRRSQTFREFCATVDEVLREEGLFEIVKKLNQLPISLDNLYAAAYPAYFRLRDRGYKRYPDLT